jgi:hypothetical protein
VVLGGTVALPAAPAVTLRSLFGEPPLQPKAVSAGDAASSEIANRAQCVLGFDMRFFRVPRRIWPRE